MVYESWRNQWFHTIRRRSVLFLPLVTPLSYTWHASVVNSRMPSFAQLPSFKIRIFFPFKQYAIVSLIYYSRLAFYFIFFFILYIVVYLSILHEYTAIRNPFIRLVNYDDKYYALVPIEGVQNIPTSITQRNSIQTFKIY